MAALKVHPKTPHKYLRIPVHSVKGRVRWKCVLPGCTHWIADEMILGAHCMCWRCGSEFVIDKVAMDLKKPHCSSCTRRRKDDVIEEALNEIEESPI